MASTRREFLESAQRLPLFWAPFIGLQSGRTFAAVPKQQEPADPPFRIGILRDPETINGILARHDLDRNITARFYEKLLRRSDSDADPSLVAGWEYSEDALTLTLALHPDARWQDGNPVLAEDIVLSLGAARSTGLVDATWLDAVADGGNVRITLPEPNSFFVDKVLREVPALPSHIWPADTDAWATDSGSDGTDPSRVVGTGEYAFKEWHPRDHLTIVAAPDYWTGRLAARHEVVWRFFEDVQSLIAALEELDDAYGVDAIIVPAGTDLTGIDQGVAAIVPYDTLWSAMVVFNLDPVRPTPLHEVRIRQALNYAIDRLSIKDRLLGGFARLVGGTQSPLSQAYSSEDEGAPVFDVDAARALLAEGLAALGLGEVTITLLVAPGFAEDVVNLLRQNWNEIGVDVQIERAADWSPLVNGQFDAWIGWRSWSPTGDQADAFATGRPANFGRFTSPEYDELVAQAKVAFDPAQRQEVLRAADAIVIEAVPALFLWYEQEIAVVDRRVVGFEPNGLDRFATVSRVTIEG